MPKKTPSKNKKVKQKTTATQAQKVQKSTVSTAETVSTVKTPVTPITQKSPNILTKKLENDVFRGQVYAVLFGVLFIVLTLSIVFVWIPNVVKNTDDYKAIAEKAKQEEQAKKDAETTAQQQAEREQLIAEENTRLQFENQSVTMTTNYGDIVIDLAYQTAPQSVENFVRLTSRGFYTDQTIHRMVESDGFNVIQGGQAKAGQSSEAALGGTVPDELWEVAPEFTTGEDESQSLANTPKLAQPALARDLDLATGSITYPKGLILMAKTSQANSATTQFFITLTDTILPAQYTAFGTVRADSFGVLDTIREQVTPEAAESAQEAPEGYLDGAPNPAITYSIALSSATER